MKVKSHDTVRFCKYCRSDNIVKQGRRRNKSGTVQRYVCRACKQTFSANFGFRYRRYDPAVISEALYLFYSNMSVRGIADVLRMRGITVSPSAIYKWVRRYSKIAAIYTDSLTPSVGNWYRGDEVWVNIMGKKYYLFATMDDDTRYWLAGELADSKDKHDADNIFRLTKAVAGGKNPTALITDKLPAYRKAARKIFGSKTYHHYDAGIRSKRIGHTGRPTGSIYHPSNNKMERLNGTIRDREKTFRGLGTPDTPVFEGLKVHYNHVRTHDALKNRTPAEAAGIIVEGGNKWLTIIQNSSLHMIATDQRLSRMSRRRRPRKPDSDMPASGVQRRPGGRRSRRTPSSDARLLHLSVPAHAALDKMARANNLSLTAQIDKLAGVFVRGTRKHYWNRRPGGRSAGRAPGMGTPRQRTIQVHDAAYLVIKDMADANGRSASAQLSLMIGVSDAGVRAWTPRNGGHRGKDIAEWRRRTGGLAAGGK